MRKYVLQSIVGGSCLLLLAGVGYFALYPHWLAYRHTTQAQQALDRYDLAQAQTHLQRVLQLQPSSAEMHFLMARTCRRAANYPAANHHLSEARRLGWVEDMLELEEHLSDAQRQGPSGPNEKVLQALVRARHPEDRAILETLYKGYKNALYLNEAATWLTVWIERYPNDWLPYLWRGDLLQSFRHFDKARADYQRLLELKADCSEAHLHLGQIALANAEESETALHHFRTYLGSHPGDAEALLGIAQCQTNLHHPEAAIATLRELLVQHPEHAAGMRLLAMREMEQGRTEEAVSWLRRAIALAPNDQDTLYQLTLALHRLGQDQEAERYQSRFKELDETSRAAKATLDKILAQPHNASLRCDMGKLLLRIDKTQQAERWFLSALHEDPEHRPTHQALAEYYEKKSNPPARERAEFHRRKAG